LTYKSLRVTVYLQHLNQGEIMEITFVWSWFSFIVGSLSSVATGVTLLLIAAVAKWKKTNRYNK
jgi:hypothetical protein